MQFININITSQAGSALIEQGTKVFNKWGQELLTDIMSKMNKILVGIDGSEASQKAARFAADLASFYGAKVTLMYVAPHSIDTKMSARLTYSASKTIDVDHKLDEAEKIMDMKKVAYDTVAELGDAAPLILAQSGKEYDLIVLGKRGMSGLEEFVMGSVSSEVAHKTKVPVLIVP
jgi:nucleotide-binding universal stress UspA family protein